MKRRLTSAYDHMTMPDACRQSIEKKLEESLKQQRAGRYTRVIPPSSPRRGGWFTAVAAVCLILVLSVGGSALLLRGLPQMEHQPEESAAEILQSVSETPSDHYAEATSHSAEKVENFAKIICYNLLEKNWAALENKVHFPVTIQEEEISDWETFVERMDAYFGHYLYKDRIGRETCQAMFCNWQGISMANGLIWINDVDGSLKITAVDVEIQEELTEEDLEKQVPLEFSGVLRGEVVKFTGNRDDMTLEEYCAALWGAVTVNKFTVTDLDADNVCEVVLPVQTEQAEAPAHLVLRQEGTEICAYSFRPGEMYNLKKDGTFGSSKGGPGQGSFRLRFEGEGACAWSRAESAENVMDVLWHAYPCQKPELLLQSYKYATGTGQSLLPGGPYYHFEGMALGSMGNDWSLREEYLTREGMICGEDEGTITVFDADAPGTALYGTLTNENGRVQLTELGFFICTEEKEYVAEVRNMLSEAPEYWVDAHLPALGSMGRQVDSPEELIGYLGFSPVPDEQTLKDQQDIRSLVDDFVAACLTGDPKAMEPYLAENAQGRVGKFPKDRDLVLMNYGILPDQTMGEWGRYAIYPTAQISGQEGQFILYLGLVKQPDGWKVESYRVER